MCRAMEEMRNKTAEKTLFKANLEHVLMSMKKLGWTKEQALEFYEIPKAEYPRYIAAI